MTATPQPSGVANRIAAEFHTLRSAYLYSTRRRVRIEGNAALADAAEHGQIDVALVVGQEHRRSAHVFGELEVGWIAGRGFAPTAGQPLPLVLLGPQCVFRKAAISQLDAAGIPWRVAATSPSLAGLWASAVGGLGITVRSRLALPETLVWRRHLFSLPALEPFPVTILTQPHANSQSVERLRAIIGEEVAAALPAPARRRKRGASQSLAVVRGRRDDEPPRLKRDVR